MIRRILKKFRGRSDKSRLSAEDFSKYLTEIAALNDKPNKVHPFILRLFDDVFDADNSKNHLLYHKQGNGKVWKRFPDFEIFKIPTTMQLEYLADDKGIEYLTYKNPLFKKIAAKFDSDDNFEQAMLFRVDSEHDYLALFQSNHKAKSDLEFFQAVVSNLITNFKTRGKNILLEEKIKALQNTLAARDNKLTETERSLRKRIYEINNLLEISDELYSILDLEQLLNAALLIIIGQVGSEKAFILLHEPMQSGFQRYFHKGFGADPTYITVDLDHPIVSYLSKNPGPVIIRELLKLQELKPFAEELLAEKIVLLAPISISNRIEGLICCGEKIFGDDWGRSDIRMFNILVNIISISLSNARMYENVKMMSFTDGMTGLNNYRYFDNRLREEIKRAQRSGGLVSLIILDIDHFKNYNDSLGHQSGDEALRKLGLLLKNTAREDDIVNRYGGEEFTVILPGVEKSSIAVLAERLRKKVEDEDFFKQNVQPGGSLTISLGAAAYPDDADSGDQLIARADQALYASKAAGRNRFTVYDESLDK